MDAEVSEESYTVFSNGTLRIRRPDYHMEGEYRCIAISQSQTIYSEVAHLRLAGKLPVHFPLCFCFVFIPAGCLTMLSHHNLHSMVFFKLD